MPITQTAKVPKGTSNRLFDTVGDGSGSFDLAQNFSVTPGVFLYKAPSGESIIVTEIFMNMIDNNGFNADGYGGNNTPLNNGVLLELIEDGVAEPIGLFRKNADYQFRASNFQFYNYQGTADGVRADFNFQRSTTQPTIIVQNGNFLRLTISDDLSFINEHNFGVIGSVY